MAVNVNFGGWVKVARTLAGHRGFGIRYVDDDEIARVGAEAWNDGRYAYVRQPEAHWTDEQFKLWLYFLVHEIGHSTPTRRGVFDVLKNRQPQGFLRFVHNLMEDQVQERDLFGHERVLQSTLSEGRAAFYRYLITTKFTPDYINFLRENPAGQVLFGWDALIRADFMRDVVGYDLQLTRPIEGCDPRIEVWRDRLNSGDYADVLRNIPTVEDVFELAERIVREVFEENPDEQQQQPGDGQGEGEGEASQNQGQQGDGQGQSQGEGSEGESGGAGEQEGGSGGSQGSDSEDAGSAKGDRKGGKLSAGEATVSYDDLLGHNHSQDGRQTEDGEAPDGGLVIDYTEYFSSNRQEDQFVPDFDNLIVYDLAKGEYPRHDQRGRNGPANPSTLSKRIGRYMQAHSKNKRLHGTKQGKLSGKNLYKLRVPGMTQESKQRVFQQKIINQSKNVAVSILVDLSGSMSRYGKSQAAVDSVTHLHEVISRQLRIPLEIIGFSEHPIDEHPAHVVFQSFGKVRTNEQIEEDMRRCIPFQAANRDGEAILWARDRLLAQKAGRHIMIVLSDGQPVGSTGGDVAAFTKEVCENIDADPRIELHGIGILSDSVRWFYSSYDVIYDVSELEEKLLTVLRNKIIINI